MNVRLVMSCVFACLAAVAQAQTQQSPRENTAAQPPVVSAITATIQHPPAAELSPDAVVVTVHGVCAKSARDAAHSDTCATTITREEFERMLSAMSFNPQLLSNPVAVRSFAESYAQALVLADAAEKAGLAKDANFEELMKIVRIRTLADAYRRLQQEHLSKVSPEEIEAYYKDNVANYEQVELDRLFIPRASSKPTQESKAAFEERARKLADQAHDRIANGEDIVKVQVETYKALGLTPPLTTDMGALRRGKAPRTFESDIFSAKAAEVTKVEEDAAGFTVYKVRAHTTLPIDRVRDEISHQISQKKIEAASKALTEQVHSDLNEQFFRTQHPSLRAPATERAKGE